MIDYLKERFSEISTWRGILAIVAAIVMYFTPDDIDKIIMMFLTAMGVTDVFKVEKQ